MFSPQTSPRTAFLPLPSSSSPALFPFRNYFLHSFLRFFALSCKRAKRIPFLFNHLRALCKNTGGCTHRATPIPKVLLEPPPFRPRTSLLPYLLTSLPLTAKLFPIRSLPCLKPRKLLHTRP